ncbi:hypothetical protein HDU97_008451 [Phlyctochytrium planicorne]|nr:hypothetical protein HDU97_008451 [Phlyctochytrium planicorne]
MTTGLHIHFPSDIISLIDVCTLKSQPGKARRPSMDSLKKTPTKQKKPFHLMFSSPSGGHHTVDIGYLRLESRHRLKTAWENLFERYGRSFEDEADEIDLETGKVVVDKGFFRRTSKPYGFGTFMTDASVDGGLGDALGASGPGSGGLALSQTSANSLKRKKGPPLTPSDNDRDYSPNTPSNRPKKMTTPVTRASADDFDDPWLNIPRSAPKSKPATSPAVLNSERDELLLFPIANSVKKKIVPPPPPPIDSIGDNGGEAGKENVVDDLCGMPIAPKNVVEERQETPRIGRKSTAKSKKKTLTLGAISEDPTEACIPNTPTPAIGILKKHANSSELSLTNSQKIDPASSVVSKSPVAGTSEPLPTFAETRNTPATPVESMDLGPLSTPSADPPPSDARNSEEPQKSSTPLATPTSPKRRSNRKSPKIVAPPAKEPSPTVDDQPLPDTSTSFFSPARQSADGSRKMVLRRVASNQEDSQHSIIDENVEGATTDKSSATETVEVTETIEIVADDEVVQVQNHPFLDQDNFVIELSDSGNDFDAPACSDDFVEQQASESKTSNNKELQPSLPDPDGNKETDPNLAFGNQGLLSEPSETSEPDMKESAKSTDKIDEILLGTSRADPLEIATAPVNENFTLSHSDPTREWQSGPNCTIDPSYFEGYEAMFDLTTPPRGPGKVPVPSLGLFSLSTVLDAGSLDSSNSPLLQFAAAQQGVSSPPPCGRGMNAFEPGRRRLQSLRSGASGSMTERKVRRTFMMDMEKEVAAKVGLIKQRIAAEEKGLMKR